MQNFYEKAFIVAFIKNRVGFLSIKKYFEIQMQSYQIASHEEKRAYLTFWWFYIGAPLLKRRKFLSV